MNYLFDVFSKFILYYRRSGIEPLIYYFINSIIIILSVCLLIKCFIYNYNIVVSDIQLEFREGAQLVFTQDLLDGKNPYSIENQPQSFYVYGPLYNLVVFPFSMLLGNTFILHKIISAFFIILSLISIVYICKKLSFGLGFTLAVSAVLYQQLLFRTTPLARPDALAFFLFLSSMGIFALNINTKSKIYFSAILLVLSFFTKQYFALGFIILSTAIFLISIRAAIHFSVIVFLGVIIPLMIISFFMELFLPSFIFNSINSFKPDYSHLVRQLNSYVTNYYSLLFGYLGLSIFLFKRLKNTRLRDAFNNSINTSIYTKLEIQGTILCICSLGLIISTVFLYFKMGRHVGANMIYFYQLLTIFLIVLSGYLLQFKYLRLIIVLVLAINIYSLTTVQKTNLIISKELDDLETEICSHDRVLNNPAVVGIMIKCGKKIWDSGLSKYFPRGAYKYAPGISLRIKNTYSNYESEITRMASNREFDLILTIRDKSGYGFWNQKYLPFHVVLENYDLVDTLKITLLYQKYKIELWEPKNNHDLSDNYINEL